MTQEQANWEWMDARVKKLEEHCFPAKTLTDEEINDLIVNKVTDADMIREALRKAQE